ncbi:MAG: leucine-rich repeat protein [Clostridia bacterium]|nr:leucine-rich repeat protein [Clostridia bacterium]
MKKRIISFLVLLSLLISLVPTQLMASTVVDTSTNDVETTTTETETEQTTEEEAESTTHPDWEYEVYGDGVALTKYLGNQIDIYVPNKLEVNGEEYTVLKLADSIFENNDAVNSVSLASGILEIGAKAFYDCDNLVCILVSEELTSIGAEAFYGCDSFNSVILYDNITSIGENAFTDCGALVIYCYCDSYAYSYASLNNISFKLLDSDATPEIVTYDYFLYHISNGEATLMGPAGDFTYTSHDIVIPAYVNGAPVTKIGSFAFRGKSFRVVGVSWFSQYYMTLPETIKYIGESAFLATSLASINLPKNITEIHESTFAGTDLYYIELGENIKKIDDYAFESSDLNELPNLENVEEIGYEAFARTALVEIVYPANVPTIEESVFRGCEQLEEVYVESFCSNLPWGTFNDCVNLKRAYISEYLYLYDDAFDGCPNLVLHIYDDTDSYYDPIIETPYYFVSYLEEEAPIIELDGMRYFIFNDEAILMYCYEPYWYMEIPETVEGYTVTKINSYAFVNITEVYDLILPNTIQHFGKYAFSGCSGLRTINIPEGVVSLPEYIFSECYSLMEITLPESLEIIGNSAFSRSGLYSLPDFKNVKEISYYAFEECDNITEIIMPSGIALDFGVFNGCDSLTNLIIPEGIEIIPASTFYGSDSLEIVIIPQSVIDMGNNCITGKNLVLGIYGDSCAKQYAIDNNIPYYDVETEPQIEIFTIGTERYFIVNNEAQVASSTGRFDITIPSFVNGYPVTVIRPYAFAELYLDEVVLPETIREIGDYAFYWTYLERINLLEGLEKIGACAFFWTNIGTIKLPSTLKYLGSGAFAYSDYGTFPDVSGLEYIGDGVFRHTGISGTLVIKKGVNYGANAFEGCTGIKNVIIESGVTSIEGSMFAECWGLRTVLIPSTVVEISPGAFHASNKAVLLVFEKSYAYKYAIENNLEYFVLPYEENPEIAYGSAIEGTVTNSDGTVASGATVEIYYEDGTLKESVTTDENGKYAFTYAEVGKYTIKAYNSLGNTASTVVYVKRMNVFDVFLSGDTSITLKTSYTVSGSLSENATVKLTDLNGNVISTVTGDAFTFTNVANGTYLVVAESENGSVSQEITVFNSNVTDIYLEINTNTANIWGYVEVEDRKYDKHRRNWVEISVYNEEGNVIATQKSDKDGKYSFENLPFGDYSIVAKTTEMRPDKKHGYDRSYELYGYAYISITESGTFEIETIVLYEENDYTTTVSGKANINKDKSKSCEFIMYNAFGVEYAKVTSENGKYSFKNVKDGLYIIMALTENDGMGFTVIVVRNGKIHGNTNINIVKADKIKDREDKFENEIPDFESKEQAEQYRQRIADEKRFYDSLSEKEKKQLSNKYIQRLNKYIEWLAGCENNEGVENSGLVISGDEIEKGDDISFTITVEKQEKWEDNKNGIETSKDFIHHNMKDKAGKGEIVEYYEISMTKTSNGSDKVITSVYKDTDAMGKFRVTLEIPEEYKGMKHYSLVHVHCGEVTVLTDLDDNPDTITVEIDKFSTFALATTNEDLVDEAVSTVTIDDIIKFKGYSVGPDGTSMCVGFDIDKDALEAYEEKTGKTIDFGAVFTSYDRLNGKAPLDAITGEKITVEGAKVIKASLKEYSYTTYDFVLTNITDDIANHNFVIAGYIYDGENVLYIQSDTLSSTVMGFNLNQIKALT